MPTDNLALLQDGYAAFAAGDLVRLGELFADGIIWHMPARNPMSGDYRGKQEVFALFGQLAEQTAGTGAVALVVGCKAGHCSDDQREVSTVVRAGRLSVPREVIAVAVRWYLRYGLSYRDVEELLAERGIVVDHVTIYRWVQTFTPEFIDAARPARHASGNRWFVDETYVKVCGRWSYLYRAVDQYGQVVDVLVSTRRDASAARQFFACALRFAASPVEVVTDRAAVYPRVLDDLVPAARHVTEQYANNVIEADHGRLKGRLQTMRGLKRLSSARVIATGHAFVQNLRRGHYAITADLPAADRVRFAFDELARCL